jgi:hypothetical protein
LPTVLPRSRRAPQKRSPKRVIFDFLFNGTLIVSALALTFIVLQREEENALGRQPQTLAQAVKQDFAGVIGRTKYLPPSN